MTDLKKLRKLAEKATPTISYADNAPYWEYILAANPQAIIEVLDMVDRYRWALRLCDVRIGHIENWHRDHVTPDNFKDCQDVGVTPEAYLRETKMIAREALEGGK